jgi:predicted aminopeptidase
MNLAAVGVAWLIFSLLAGCESVGYYSQAAGGQLQLVYQRQKVDQLIASLRAKDLDELQFALLSQLELSQRILHFAEQDLGLDVGKRYRSYVALDKPSVVWNLFAAPELSLEPRTWCYPFVGCAPYRGYFQRDDALRYQRKLEAEGFETYLGGVAAYSTLGWFDDPLLSSFIHWPEANLADLLFHELAHSLIWVKGDVAFNEAFASFVGREGMQQWLVAQGEDSGYAEFQDRQHARQRLQQLLYQAKSALSDVYLSERVDVAKRQAKDQIIGAVRHCFEQMPEQFGGERYRRLFAGLNNALLVSIATYDDFVPAFAVLFERSAQSWPKFFAEVEVLTDLDDQTRLRKMRELGEGQITDHADDDGADQIQCEALAGHSVDAHPAGTEHDDVRRGGDW